MLNGPHSKEVNMRTIVRTAILAVAILGVSAQGAAGKPGGEPAIPLNPDQETGVVDSDASGFFSYTIAGNELCYTLEVRDLTAAPVAAHIHPGQRNVAGPVAVPLATPPGATSSVSECITSQEGGVLTPAELDTIASEPRAFYVNVHTPQYPGGEIRGQLK
jgi:hypothetical protein